MSIHVSGAPGMVVISAYPQGGSIILVSREVVANDAVLDGSHRTLQTAQRSDQHL